MSVLDPGATPAPEPTTAEPASSGPDLSPVFDRLEQIGGTVGQLAEQFQTWSQAQQAPQEPEQNWWESLFDDPDALPQQPEPVQPVAPQLNATALQQAVQQAIQQSNAPLVAQLQQIQRQQALNELTTKIPQLKDPEVAKATEERLAQSVAHLPQQVQEALAWDPTFIETIFKAAEAEKLAGAQEPAGEAPQLETAGGANPGGTGEETNIVHRVHSVRPTVPKGFL